MAISRTGKFRVWSLSWHDVQEAFQSQGDYCTNTLDAMAMPSGKKIYYRILGSDTESLVPESMGSLELLVQYLSDHEAEKKFATHARARSFSLLDPSKRDSLDAFNNWHSVMSSVKDATHFLSKNHEFKFKFGANLFGVWSPRPESNGGHITVYSVGHDKKTSRLYNFGQLPT